MSASRGTSNHPVGEVRHGQLITTYGPGAMVDLPDRSVVVGGLNLWHYSRDDDSCFIDEPRLSAVSWRWPGWLLRWKRASCTPQERICKAASAKACFNTAPAA